MTSVVSVVRIDRDTIIDTGFQRLLEFVESRSVKADRDDVVGLLVLEHR
jgi:hypothetical protein